MKTILNRNMDSQDWINFGTTIIIGILRPEKL